MQSIEPLKTTDGLGEGKGGIWKKWPWKDLDHHELMSDLILKANYSIQDFNAAIKDGFSLNIKDTVFLVALATWIKDAYWQINCTCLKEEIRTKFEFSRQNELTEARNYLEAVRSIVIAHPLNSTRHEEYGFGPEGRICIDMRRKRSRLISRQSNLSHHTKRIRRNRQCRGQRNCTNDLPPYSNRKRQATF